MEQPHWFNVYSGVYCWLTSAYNQQRCTIRPLSSLCCPFCPFSPFCPMHVCVCGQWPYCTTLGLHKHNQPLMLPGQQQTSPLLTCSVRLMSEVGKKEKKNMSRAKPRWLLLAEMGSRVFSLAQGDVTRCVASPATNQKQ